MPCSGHTHISPVLPHRANKCHLFGKTAKTIFFPPLPPPLNPPLCSLQQSAPNPQILSLPAGRAETLPVPSPSPPTTLIHQIPGLQPTPSPDSSNPGTRCPLTKAEPSIKKQLPITPVPMGPRAEQGSSKPKEQSSTSASSCHCHPHRRDHGPLWGHGDRPPTTPEGLQLRSGTGDLNQGSLIENKRDFILKKKSNPEQDICAVSTRGWSCISKGSFEEHCSAPCQEGSAGQTKLQTGHLGSLVC